MRAQLRRGAAALVLLTGLGLGCGSGEPDLAPVQGRVYYKGAPLTGGCVVFTPNSEKGGRGAAAWAVIGADGGYQLQTADRPGAVAGWHRVSISAVEAAPGDGPFHDARALIPPRYAAPDLSGLEGQVRIGQVNVIDFHLE